jgi:hypothetical protein
LKKFTKKSKANRKEISQKVRRAWLFVPWRSSRDRTGGMAGRGTIFDQPRAGRSDHSSLTEVTESPSLCVQLLEREIASTLESVLVSSFSTSAATATAATTGRQSPTKTASYPDKSSRTFQQLVRECLEEYQTNRTRRITDFNLQMKRCAVSPLAPSLPPRSAHS